MVSRSKKFKSWHFALGLRLIPILNDWKSRTTHKRTKIAISFQIIVLLRKYCVIACTLPRLPYHCSIKFNTSKRDFLKKIKKSSYKSFLSKTCSFTENLSRWHFYTIIINIHLLASEVAVTKDPRENWNRQK